MTFSIGLTGGLGSGKSTTADYFKALGVPVIDADVIAKSLVAKDSPALNKIVEHFGTTILLSNGELNRQALRKLIFENNDHKKWLEALLHPSIRTSIEQQIQAITYPYCIVVIPLLAENFAAFKHLLNHVVVVQAPESIQIDRVGRRDKSEQPLIKKMIKSQASNEDRQNIANTLLDNTGTLEELAAKVKTLHQGFLQKSGYSS